MMRQPTMMIAFVAAALLIGVSASPRQANADYAMPTLESAFAGIAVIDASVDRYDKKGVAHVTIHKQIVGQKSPAALFGVRYTCFGGSLKTYGVEVGKRYIFLLHGDEMFEEMSRFEVIEAKNKPTIVRFGSHYRDWLRLPKEDMALPDALRAFEKLVVRFGTR